MVAKSMALQTDVDFRIFVYRDADNWVCELYDPLKNGGNFIHSMPLNMYSSRDIAQRFAGICGLSDDETKDLCSLLDHVQFYKEIQKC